MFGSNRAGRHGRGAAKQALKWGAVHGQGEGLMGSTYGIPTKGRRLEILSTRDIGYAVARFLKFAATRPDLTFLVTRIGCGLADYRPKDIAPLFHAHRIPNNVRLPACFWAIRNMPDPRDRQPRWVESAPGEEHENSRGECD